MHIELDEVVVQDLADDALQLAAQNAVGGNWTSIRCVTVVTAPVQ